MSHVDTRQSSRDSLLVLAKLRVDGDPGDLEHRVKVRNLSASGMMAEGDVKVSRGSLISVELRNIGWVDGTVAWKQDDRFGIAFIEEIDPIKVRILEWPCLHGHRPHLVWDMPATHAIGLRA